MSASKGKEEPKYKQEPKFKEEPILEQESQVKQEPILKQESPVKQEPILEQETQVKQEPNPKRSTKSKQLSREVNNIDLASKKLPEEASPTAAQSSDKSDRPQIKQAGLIANSGLNQSENSHLNHNLDFAAAREEDLLLLKRAVEATTNGICITDPRQEDNPIIYVNPAFLRLSGYREEQVLGRNCRFLQRDDRDQAPLKNVREAIKNGTPITVVVKNYRKDGTPFWNELTISPVHDEKQRVTHFIGIQNDITARIEAEKQVSEFYSVISHELKTPLTAINGALSVIADGAVGKINSRASRLVDIALDNSERLIRLISDILDWKKIEAGKFKLHRQNVKPADLIKKALDATQHQAEKRGISLTSEITVNNIISVDPDRIIQVLTNLIDNAIKFSPTNSSVKIKVFSQHPHGDTIRFSVSDQGPGISAAAKPELFKHFYQVDSSDTRSRGGTGLGLAICKSLVELHGGQIGLTSTTGQGSTFWFDLYTQDYDD